MSVPGWVPFEEFQIRHFARGTQKNYLHCISRLAQHFSCSPGDKLESGQQ